MAIYKQSISISNKDEQYIGIINERIETNMRPQCVYSVKRTCAELGVSHKTLRKYRENGYIKPVNPGNSKRPKYSGQSIIECWHTLAKL